MHIPVVNGHRPQLFSDPRGEQNGFDLAGLRLVLSLNPGGIETLPRSNPVSEMYSLHLLTDKSWATELNHKTLLVATVIREA